LEGGGKETGIMVSSETLFLLRKIKRVYLGLGRRLGLEDTPLFFYADEEYAQPSLRDIAN